MRERERKSSGVAATELTEPGSHYSKSAVLGGASLSLRAASHRLGGPVGDGVHRRPGVEQPERKVDGGMTDRCESSILISVALVGIVGGSSLGRPVHI